MLNYAMIQSYITAGLIKEQRHPQCTDLAIFNYTPHCQYAGAWDAVTMACRGLILNTKTDAIVANVMPKFFNYGEQEVALPKEAPHITEKVDGSLGILYWLHDEPWIATRGSFTSTQAVWATAWLRATIDIRKLWREVTYLVEIIYPANRVVVRYDFSGLVLFAARVTTTGNDLAPCIPCAGLFPYHAKMISPTDLATLTRMNTPNSEGFVAHWPSTGLRIKIKFPDYVRLHRLLTGLSEKTIWALLRDDTALDDQLEGVPDEWMRWFETTRNTLLAGFQRIWTQVDADFQMLRSKWQQCGYVKDTHRKEMALSILARQYPHLLFAMLDGKTFDQQIWKMLEPKGARTFHEEVDDE